MIGWLDCSAGVSGDMLLGALVDAGVALERLQSAVDGVGVEPVRLSQRTVTRAGIGAVKVDVVVDEHPRTRTWADVRGLVEAADLPTAVAATALDVFGRLAAAEAAVHRTSPDDVHFHEVGALDAVADVVGGAAGLHALGLTRLTASPVVLGSVQGSFGLRPDPFAGVAEAAGIGQDEVLERVRYLLEKRIIREITPIFDTRALGYASMLVAAKVDPEHPHRAAQFINSHPGVTHNYLRNHEFNLWFTLAVEPDSQLGLDGTLEVMAAKTGAESIRQLPTLKLFKIRMDLEMEGGTDALKTAGEAVEPMELDPIELHQADIAVIKATQGPMEVSLDPYAPAAERLGVPVADVLARLESLRERGALRRVAAILYHRRAGFSANGMGVWAVPEGEILDTGRRMAAFRGISHCYQRPTYPDWPYSVFTMAHGRSKEECDAILDSIAEETGITARSTLYSSTEFKKVRMLYFTDDFKRWEQEHGS